MNVALEEVDSRLLPMVRRLAEATIPLCQPQRLTVPRPVGSGVLIEVEQHRFLLTAAHVLDNASKDSPVYAIVLTEFVTLGFRWRTRATERTQGKDRGDLAIIPLGKKAADAWSECRALKLEDFDPSLNPMDIVPTTGFLAIGFPNTKQPKILKKGGYAPAVHHFLSNAELSEDHRNLGLISDLHIAIGYDPRGFTSSRGRNELPKPVGMSGGGLWRIPFALGVGQPEPKLVGILNEYHKSPNHVIVATRLSPVLRALVQFVPETRPSIERRFPGLID
ncbi:MAG: trypsin-like peptidase domain-containing protein [Actinobacteria bacterium]|nr:trypsin-like peptidase domain-containing protein [Actinomycetota bacterium]